MTVPEPITISDEVAAAVRERRPVVALESTIFSRLGLPDPDNRTALERCTAAIRAGGAVPALTAVVAGVARIGIDEEDAIEAVLAGDRKVSARDLPVALAQRWPLGATTVSATLTLADRAGVRVFATGGIGGVHRDVHASGDVSADLDAIARHAVVTVSAGAKAFLDLGRTLERLETLRVPVLGLQTDEFPAFYSRSSGYPVQARVDDPADAAATLVARDQLGIPGGVLLAVPIPVEAEIPRDVLDAAILTASEEADTAGVSGADVTPFVLERIAAVTGGRSVTANLALAEHNAVVAAAVAAHLRGWGGWLEPRPPT